MNYIEGNKEAWEEAFDNRMDGWGETVARNLSEKSDFYINPSIKTELDKLDLRGKKAAQFCCNNGRELLSLAKHYGIRGTGFDIAENLIMQGRQNAAELNLPCEFAAANILDIGGEYHNSFDMVLFTLGAVTWFEDLEPLFRVAADCLKPGGLMLLHDFHPFMNMLPLPGEASYRSDIPVLLEHKYFTKEPWIENNGMGYISGDYPSKTFTSFSHSVSEMINAAVKAGMDITRFEEYDQDVGLSDAYDGKGLPLSMLMITKKAE